MFISESFDCLSLIFGGSMQELYHFGGVRARAVTRCGSVSKKSCSSLNFLSVNLSNKVVFMRKNNALMFMTDNKYKKFNEFTLIGTKFNIC
jgi:hypothetical protein